MPDQPFILIADDDKDDRSMLQFAFEKKHKGTPLVFVSNGVELMHYLDGIKQDTSKQAANHYPKIILLDLNMPKMDGREALKRIKSEPDFNSINVIIFSTTQDEVQIKSCYDLGADSYICKPSNFSKLQDTVDGIAAKFHETDTAS